MDQCHGVAEKKRKKLLDPTTWKRDGRLVEVATALRKLEAIAAITGWSIDPKSDLVHVMRTPSQAQARYLANRDEKTRV